MSQRHYLVLDEQDRGLVRAVGSTRSRDRRRGSIQYVLRESKGGMEFFVANDGRSLAAVERETELPEFRQFYSVGGRRLAAYKAAEVGAYPGWRSVVPVPGEEHEWHAVDLLRVLHFTEGVRRYGDKVGLLQSGGVFFLEDEGQVFYFDPWRVRLAAEQVLRLTGYGFEPCCRAYVFHGSGGAGVLLLESVAPGMRWRFVMMACPLPPEARCLGANKSLD